MGNEALKLELIQWLSELEDGATLEHLRVLKDSFGADERLSEGQKQSIERGLKDVEEGRTVAHEEVKKKYGL